MNGWVKINLWVIGVLAAEEVTSIRWKVISLRLEAWATAISLEILQLSGFSGAGCAGQSWVLWQCYQSNSSCFFIFIYEITKYILSYMGSKGQKVHLRPFVPFSLLCTSFLFNILLQMLTCLTLTDVYSVNYQIIPQLLSIITVLPLFYPLVHHQAANHSHCQLYHYIIAPNTQLFPFVIMKQVVVDGAFGRFVLSWDIFSLPDVQNEEKYEWSKERKVPWWENSWLDIVFWLFGSSINA